MTLVEWGPASVHAIEAVEKWKGSQDPRETGFGLAFGGKTIFEYLAEREGRGLVFGSAMGNFSRGWGHRVQFLVEGYEWDSLGEGTVVDVSLASPSSSSHPLLSCFSCLPASPCCPSDEDC